tara:strand:+ start:1562 stop:2401 length:840 start_codon:yes stop_codon:yes gene_type:complete
MIEELNLKELFTAFVNFIFRNLKLLLIVIVIGVIGVISFQKLKTPYYETRAICISGISEYEHVGYQEGWLQRTAIDMINHLEINIANRDFNQVSELLGVEVDIAKSIKFIEAEQLYQKDMNEEFFTLNKFEISLSVFNNNNIHKIEEGLVFYFNNNPYVNEYYTSFKNSKEEVIRDINNEMNLLDEIRLKGLADQVNNITKVVSSNGLQKSEINNQIAALSEYREKIKMQKNLLRPLTFVQSFAKVNRPENEILIWSLIGAFISFIIGVFIARVREVKD